MNKYSHNRYSYGQLFCFSGIDGETSRNDDFVGMLMDEPITIRFHFEETVTLRIPLEENAVFYGVTGDMLDGKDAFVGIIDRRTIVGKSGAKPCVLTEGESTRAIDGNTESVQTSVGTFYLTVEEKDGEYYFAFAYGKKAARVYTDEELDALKKARYAYFETMPECRDKKYEKLYYKCLSIQKENVYSPEGRIPCHWTTPDRVPHRFMWLWDSAFHAMALSEYNLELAKDAIRAVLLQQKESGFIAHMMSPNEGGFSNVTQPQVLSWGVWEVYQKCKDKEFLRECAPALSKFLIWTMENRDKNGNGLLEWFTEPDYLECKCGESGLDNCPRFDFDIEIAEARLVKAEDLYYSDVDMIEIAMKVTTVCTSGRYKLLSAVSPGFDGGIPVLILPDGSEIKHDPVDVSPAYDKVDIKKGDKTERIWRFMLPSDFVSGEYDIRVDLDNGLTKLFEDVLIEFKE